MSEVRSAADIKADNEQSLQDLKFEIEASQGEFKPILARCNYAILQRKLARQLRQLCTHPIRRIVLPPSTQHLYATLQKDLANQPPTAVMVFGLEEVVKIDGLLTSMNAVREEFRKNCRFPLIFWVNDELLRHLIRWAPDFESWATLTEFSIVPDDLLHVVRRKLEKLFSAILDAGADRFLTNEMILGTHYRDELRFAREALTRNGQLDPELEACCKFLEGRDAYASDLSDPALVYCQYSLEFWQQQNNCLREGVVQFQIGLCYYRKGELKSEDSYPDWEKARHAWQQCIDCFEKLQRSDLVAKFISQLWEVLQQLEDWYRLQMLAKKALALHQNDGNQVLLAQDYSCLAAVEIHHECWPAARELAEQAWETLQNVPVDRWRSQGLVVLEGLLKARHPQTQTKEMLDELKERSLQLGPQNKPQLYIEILERLRNLYLDREFYLEAFILKQERRSVQQEYGLRGFVGAGRLKLQRQHQFAPGGIDPQTAPAPEIDKSRRAKDIEALLDRIRKPQHKLIVIYGQSGVGKSSIVEAGLIPKLLWDSIGTRDAIPVLLRVYTNWIEDLGKKLTAALRTARANYKPNNSHYSRETILQQLQQNTRRNNFLVILIFDQFEEFFIACQDRDDQYRFAEFLRDCLNTPQVKVVLSLREDYLDWLLRWSLQVDLDAINNNILDKEILYYIKNFSLKEAKTVIQNLMEQAQLNPEPGFVDALVEDLAGGVDVRPIELQVVGAQLQTEEINTLERYREKGPKDELVKRYLQEFIEDCGSKTTQKVAGFVLYVLTEKSDTRPLKTRDQLEADLADLATNLADIQTLDWVLENDKTRPLETQVELEADLKDLATKLTDAQTLDLVLRIFVESGLVVLWPGSADERYQLVHDYFVTFIRQQQEPEIDRLKRVKLALEQAKKQREDEQRAEAERQRTQLEKQLLERQLQAEQELTQRRTQQLELQKLKLQRRLVFSAWVLSTALVILAAAGFGWWQTASGKKQIELASLNEEYQTLILRDLQLEAAVTIARAGKQLRHKTPKSKPDRETLDMLRQSVYEVQERNRLETDRARAGFLSVSVSPDDQWIAAGSDDGTIQIWSKTGELLKTLRGHKNFVLCVHFSPDGQLLASANADGTVKLWNRDGKVVKTLSEHSGAVNWVSFSPDGQLLASAGEDGTVKLWNRQGELLKSLDAHNKAVLKVSFRPDGKQFASASADEVVKLWDLEGNLLKIFTGHQDDVWSVSFSPDGELLASASDDRTIKLWTLEGTLLKTLKGHEAGVNSVDFSPDGQRIASASRDETLKLWTKDGTLISTIRGHLDTVNQVTFMRGGQILVSASRDSTVRLWEPDLIPEIFRPAYRVIGATFSPNSQIVASATNNVEQKNYDIFLWDPKTFKKRLTEFQGHREWVNEISFSSDGQWLASASDDRTVKLWQKDDGNLLNTFEGHDARVYSVSFNPDGQLIASGSGDGTVKLWRRDGTLMQVFEGHRDLVTSVRFSPDGELIASGSNDQTVKLWTLDGTVVADLEGGSGGISTVRFSPDGRRLAAATDSGRIQLWKRQGSSWQPVVTSLAGGHRESVYSLSFSPKDPIFASASRDGTVKIWDLDGTLIATLEVGAKLVESVAFSPDGNTLLAIDANNQVSVWKLDFGNPETFSKIDYWLSQACERLSNYLKYNPKVSQQDRKLCNGIEF